MGFGRPSWGTILIVLGVAGLAVSFFLASAPSAPIPPDGGAPAPTPPEEKSTSPLVMISTASTVLGLAEKVAKIYKYLRDRSKR